MQLFCAQLMFFLCVCKLGITAIVSVCDGIGDMSSCLARGLAIVC